MESNEADVQWTGAMDGNNCFSLVPGKLMGASCSSLCRKGEIASVICCCQWFCARKVGIGANSGVFCQEMAPGIGNYGLVGVS